MRTKTLIITLLLTLSCLGSRAQQLSDSVRVHFRINKVSIDTLLADNDTALRDFLLRCRDTQLIGPGKNVHIDQILVTGGCSPDGSYAVNERVGRQRAETLGHWVQALFEVNDSAMQYVNKGRDWHGLALSVIGDPNVPYKKEVLKVLLSIENNDATDNDKILRRLKYMHRGVPYRYLAAKHFPSLRTAEVFVTASSTAAPYIAIADDGVTVDADTTEATQVVEVADTTEVMYRDVTNAPSKAGYTFALKTNMLYDAALTPNIGVEFPIDSHFSVGANWMYAWWHNDHRNKQWKIYGGDINLRYYFGKPAAGSLNSIDTEAGTLRPMTGHHIGLYGQVLVFQVANGGKGYITGIPGQNLWGKPWLGGGIEYGYSMSIARRLNLDFTLGLGYISGEYRTYRPMDGHYVWQSSRRRNWVGPTKAEISLVWLIGKMPRLEGTRHNASTGKEVRR